MVVNRADKYNLNIWPNIFYQIDIKDWAAREVILLLTAHARITQWVQEESKRVFNHLISSCLMFTINQKSNRTTTNNVIKNIHTAENLINLSHYMLTKKISTYIIKKNHCK